MNRIAKCRCKWNALLITSMLGCILLGPIQAFEKAPPIDSKEQFHEGGGALTLLKHWKEEEVLAVLEAELPELDIDSITLIPAGWDNLVAEVNKEWIFRFPRREELLSLVEREQWLLTRMYNSVTMPVPYYQYIGKRTAFVGYRKIHGEALNAEEYLALSDLDRQAIAEALALFLSQMHSNINVQEARERGYQDYKAPLRWIENSLLGTLSSSKVERMICEALEVAKYSFSGIDTIVLLHNDLHGGNMAFDKELKQITGVFDFSDAKIGHYAIDFGQLFMIHPELAVRAAEVYATLRGVESLVIPAAATYILRRGFGILCFREQAQASRELRLKRQLEDFVPIWDALRKKLL